MWWQRSPWADAWRKVLHAAHSAGVVHRDIKPSNVFLRGGETAEAVLLDFGVARAAHVDVPASLRTRTGALLGTFGYMAPEQARRAKSVGPASDIFALGCVLFECLTGTRAFAGADAIDVLAKLLMDAPRAPSEFIPDVSAALDDLVVRMMAKDPAARPPNCEAVLRALDAIGEAPDRDAPPVAPSRRRRYAAAGVALSLGVAAFGAVAIQRHKAPLAVSSPSSAPSTREATPAPNASPMIFVVLAFDNQTYEPISSMGSWTKSLPLPSGAPRSRPPFTIATTCVPSRRNWGRRSVPRTSQRSFQRETACAPSSFKEPSASAALTMCSPSARSTRRVPP